MDLSRLKILQEVIMRQPFKLDYVWAAVCMMGAVYFVFRT
jgi:uncharacterized protein